MDLAGISFQRYQLSQAYCYILKSCSNDSSSSATLSFRLTRCSKFPLIVTYPFPTSHSCGLTNSAAHTWQRLLIMLLAAFLNVEEYNWLLLFRLLNYLPAFSIHQQDSIKALRLEHKSIKMRHAHLSPIPCFPLSLSSREGNTLFFIKNLSNLM